MSSSSKLLSKVNKNGTASTFDKWWILVIVVVLLTAGLVLFKPDPYATIINFIKNGLWTTIKITLISFALVLVFGLVVALARLSRVTIIKGISTVYVEIVRGIPILVQLFIWYFVVPSLIQQIGESWKIASFTYYNADPQVMAVLGLTFGYSAYMSEVYRAGIQSISKGQMEAARSLGMTYFQAMWYVILPQAVRVILPPVGNEFITLLKDSSLISVMGVADLTRRGREFQGKYYIAIEPWLMVALVYLIMTLLATRLVTWMERKFKMER
jgi:polar amino acid transport system permease protein